MARKEFRKDEVIYESGQKLTALYMIIKGSAEVSCEVGSYELHNGDVIGLPDMLHKEVYFRYVAKEALTVMEYPADTEALQIVFTAGRDAVRYFQSSLFRQINEILLKYQNIKARYDSHREYLINGYENYFRICEKNHISPGELEAYGDFMEVQPEPPLPYWFSGYYSTMEQMLSVWDHNNTDMNFLSGFMSKTCEDMEHIVGLCAGMQERIQDIREMIMNENSLDLLELYVSLYGRLTVKNGMEDVSVILVQRVIQDLLVRMEKQGFAEKDFYQQRKMEYEKQTVMAAQQSKKQQEEASRLDADIVKELKNSLAQILTFAGCDKEFAASFREHVEHYRKLVNKNSTEDDVRTLRMHITKEFNRLYAQAFEQSLKETEIPKVVWMFFAFGYVDEELAGLDHAVYLYRMANHLPTDPAQGVYSYYEWLKAIYEGKKEPCRNEFDMDFGEFLHEQVRLGKITKEEERASLGDREARVRYELENVFPSVNKTTSGRISTYCPLFSEHNLLKQIDQALVTSKRITQARDLIRSVDYGAYFRETIYTNPAEGIQKEFIHVEVLPDFILMPNIGTRGIMWQEIEGKRRTTPARMMLSLMHLEDVQTTLLKLTGQFRWEMCKREQGARWNDVSERSLTSEYFDYAQFYKKNNDLSSEAKEKIKNDLVKVKNSFKELFVRDYCIWIQFESNGAPRLNKVVRGILFTYCPFSAELREKLGINPMYKDMIAHYTMKLAQKCHRMDNLIQKQKNAGKSIPQEIWNEQEFLKK